MRLACLTFVSLFSLIIVASFCALSLAGDTPLCAPTAIGGHIGLYSDHPGWSDCNLVESYVPMSAYIVHTLATEKVITSEFKIDRHWPNVVALEAEWYTNAFIGNPYTGIVVSYLACKNTPYLIGALRFMYVGTPSPPCASWLEVVGNPTSESGEPEGTLCNFDIAPATGGLLIINVDSVNCICGCWRPVTTENSTWGQVKALYR